MVKQKRILHCKLQGQPPFQDWSPVEFWEKGKDKGKGRGAGKGKERTRKGKG